MPTLLEVRKRIRSVKNIAQITRALEAVSASRVRKAQARVLASRAFAEKAWEILINIQNAQKGTPLHPLLTQREEVNSVMLVLVTSERGLAGAYNTNVIRVAYRFAERLGKPIQWVAVGRKGRDSLIRANENVVAEFTGLPAEPTITDISPIARLAVDAYLSGEVDEVVVAYTDFISMLAQRPTVLGWLPLTTDTVANQIVGEHVKEVPGVSEGSHGYEYEPSAEAVVEELVPRFTQLQLYQAVLESLASEHAARMAAMRNATDNASQLTEDLTLDYNKARQTAITGEILDIVGGAQALQQAIDASAAEILKADDASTTPIIAVEQVSKPSTTVPSPAMEEDKEAEQLTPPPDEKPEAQESKGADQQPTKTESTQPKTAAKGEPVGKSRSGKTIKQDDLTIVEGIGPKMSKALIAAGIDTWAGLSEVSEETLRTAIEAAGMRFAPSLPTWPEQAKLAANHDFEGLADFQDSLTAGRKD